MLDGFKPLNPRPEETSKEDPEIPLGFREGVDEPWMETAEDNFTTGSHEVLSYEERYERYKKIIYRGNNTED